MRTWIKDPIAILAEGAGRGVVVEDGRIVELVDGGREPGTRVDRVFDASRHVVIPGLVNTHHHMFQTLTRAHPAAINKELFAWLETLLPIWAAHLDPDSFRLATRLALTELLMSGCTTVSDHQYLYTAGLDDAMDIQAEEAAGVGDAHDADPRLAQPDDRTGRQLRCRARCRTPTRSSPTASG